MNERKLKQLFDAARKEIPPAPADDFDQRVMQSVRREPAPAERPGLSLFDQLNLLFPHLAWAAAAVIVLCIAGELVAAALNLPDISDGVAQLSDQWLSTGTGF